MKKLMVALTVSLLAACGMTPEQEAEYYSNLGSVCGYDVKVKGKIVFVGQTDKCLRALFGDSPSQWKSNTTVVEGVVREQRIYNSILASTYKLPKYIYLTNGKVTAYQY